jgi:hypothetical protein
VERTTVEDEHGSADSVSLLVQHLTFDEDAGRERYAVVPNCAAADGVSHPNHVREV